MKEIGEGEKGKEVGPATVMRESIEIIKAMLSGDEVKYEGKAFQAFAPALKADAHIPRWQPPMYIGATGPVLQRLAGAITHGLLTASITTPKFATYSRNVMEEGAKKAGRDGSHLDLGCVVVGSVGEDPKTAREGAREMAAMYLANKVQNIKGSADTLLECAGLNLEEIQPIAEAMEKGGRKAAARAVSDVTLDKVCPVAGSPKQCIERLEEYHAAGCTQMMLELCGDDRLQQARLFGEKVLPHFHKK
jgi:alkanesulfonate monooxygenase SsuD/methylene tetrahydromethanopterin reductase-like flavin-dependent oxidoreductase (luciferase family)